jgi:aspartyl-tRNA(Asn)/glutamyl-tRNA(Gln) amidotransferase subunit A
MRMDADALTLEDASRLLADGSLKARDLCERSLQRVAAIDDRLRAFVTVTPERARHDAERADTRLRANDDAPLTGIPIALKDLVETAGIRTTAGSRVLQGWVPQRDAPIARYLADAGTVLLGKTNTHEFAYGTFSLPTRNPWDLDRVPGGSSGGSAAAVAAGEVLGAVGTDTGGSIRIPAACCGVSGLKPTTGLVSTEGIVPLSWTLDHAGPIARTARGCSLLLDALVNGDLFEPLRLMPGNREGRAMSYAEATEDATSTIAKLRLGIPTSYFFDIVDPEVEAVVRAATRVFVGLGAELVEVAMPAALDDLFAVYRAIQRPEATTAHVDAGWYPAKADLYSPETRAAIERGLTYSASDYIRALRARQAFTVEMEALFERVDVLLTPTLPIVAPRVNEIDRPLLVAGQPVDGAMLRFTFPFDVSGQPALTVPCGFSASGLPIGLQIAGRRFDEATVLRLGHAFQRDTDWHLRRAPIARDLPPLA